jgi:hypothetical protein
MQTLSNTARGIVSAVEASAGRGIGAVGRFVSEVEGLLL